MPNIDSPVGCVRETATTLGVRSDPQRRTRAIKDHKLRLEEHVTVDGEWKALVRLKTTEANCVIVLVPMIPGLRSSSRGFRLTFSARGSVSADLGKIHAVALDGGKVGVSDGHLNIRQSSVAWENDAAGILAELCSWDSTPVGHQHFVTDKHKRCAGVNDGSPAGDLNGLASNDGGSRGDFPEPPRTVDRNSAEIADKGGGVNVPEFVGADLAGDELCGKDR